MAQRRLRERCAVGVPSKLDAGIAVAAAVLVCVGTVAAAATQSPVRPLDAGAVALLVVTALALAWRRRLPILILTIIVALVSAYLLIGYPYGPIQLCMVVAMFEVARLRRLRTSLIACLAAVLATAAAILSRALIEADVPMLLLAVWASWLIVPWSIGALVQVRSAAAQRARRELVARAALEERMRVAREVHDVAGHGFAAVAMQAGVALLVFDEQPRQARESLEAIQTTSAKALADLRSMLDAFPRRTETDGDLAKPAATLGLRDLDELVDSVRAAGLPVQLSNQALVVPEEVGSAAYRVVQEALTNVLRHAGPTTAEVTVHRADDSLVVDVVDAGAGAEDVTLGRGLTGMRDRVIAIGGELTAQPRTGGGFRVSARLPISGGTT